MNLALIFIIVFLGWEGGIDIESDLEGESQFDGHRLN